MRDPLTIDVLKDAVSKTAAAFRCRTCLQPAGGDGDKVFPPTFAGAVYSSERRKVKIHKDEETEELETRTCVLLDSVQSQANRMEEALQEALNGAYGTMCSRC